MRKIFLLIILAAASCMGFAQFNTVTFSPATFTAEDSVVFTIDLSGTNLAGETELYIWTWANKAAGAGFPEVNSLSTNTDWGNSPAAAKFTSLGSDKWSFGLVGTNLYALPVGQLKHFQFLVKTKTGNKKTDDSPPFAFTPIVYLPKLYRLFPEVSDQDDAITLYVDQLYATTLTETRMTPLTVTVTMYNGAAVFGSPMILPLTTIGNKLHVSKTFIPSHMWNVPAGTTLTKFTYVVNGTDYDVNGSIINVSGSVNTKVFDVLQ